MGSSYIIANLSFVIVFLASVSPKDHWDYVEAFAIKDSVAALFTFIVCMWMWALRTKGDVHTFVTKEFTFDLNEASNSPTDDIAAQRVSARSVHGANDEEARTNEPLAVVVVTEEQLRESCWASRLGSHALPADDSELPAPHASDDTVAGFGHSDGHKSRGGACRAQLAEVSHRADVLCEHWEREQSVV